MSGTLTIRKRVVRSFHFDPQRGPNQVKFLAETSFKEPFVSIGHVLQRIAVNDDDRGIHPPLMGIAQFWAKHARPLGTLELDSFQK